MTRNRFVLAVFCLAAASAPGLFAQKFGAKPGLWETTTQTEMEGMPAMPQMPQIPPETLARMPPEQRERVQAMMKSRGGAGQPMTVRSCVTKESLDRGQGFGGGNQQGCTSKITSQTDSKMTVHMECDRNGSKMTGDGTYERVGDGVKGTMVMHMENGGKGGPSAVRMSFTSKFLGADCGNVKPDSPAIK